MRRVSFILFISLILGNPKLFAGVELITKSMMRLSDAPGQSHHPAISRDGRYVSFDTKSSFVEDDIDKSLDIYVYDRATKNPLRVKTVDNERLNGGGFLSSNGREIAFHSYHPSPKKSLSPHISDIFIYNFNTTQLQLATPGTKNKDQNGECLSPFQTEDSRYLLFSCNATNLLYAPYSLPSNYVNQPESFDATSSTADPVVVPLVEKANQRQIYMLDRKSKSFEMISASTSGVLGNRMSGDMKASQDGNLVFFKSASTNLIPGIPSNALNFHLYVKDRSSSTLVQLDTDDRGFNSDKWMIGQYDIDDHGKTVVVEVRDRSPENPTASLTHNDLYILDQGSQKFLKLTGGDFDNRTYSPTLSGDGRFLAFIYRGEDIKKKGRGLIVMDLKTKECRKIVEAFCLSPSFSKDGRFIVFESDEDLTHVGNNEGLLNVYVVDNPFLSDALNVK